MINSTLSNSISRTLDSSSDYCFSAGQYIFELDCSPCKMFRAEIKTFLNNGLSLQSKYHFAYEEEQFNGMCTYMGS